MPAESKKFKFEKLYTDYEAELMMNGHKPKSMDDKWFIYYEAPWLYFHRSWTGHCIYKLKLDGSPAGVRVIEAWVNINKDQFNGEHLDNSKLLQNLIESRLTKTN